MVGLLLGVDHFNIETLDSVITSIESSNPSKAGIELPEDYIWRRKMGIVVPFFDQIAAKLESRGVEIVPLDKSRLYDHHNSLFLAKQIAEGRLRREVAEEVLRKVPNEYTSPQMAYCIRKFYNLYKGALRILDKNGSSTDRINALIERSARNRERYMYQRIALTQPDVIIIGNGHAVNMRDKLASSYAYAQGF